MKQQIKELLFQYETELSNGYQYYGGIKSVDELVDKLYNLINKPVETTNEQPNLLKLYEDFRDSDILEGWDNAILLAFLYYIKKGNLEGKSFNPKYYKNTEKDVLNCRIRDLEKMYNITITKNKG